MDATKQAMATNGMVQRKNWTSERANANRPVASDANTIARPLPASGGEFPILHATFYAPGAPTTFWAGMRVKF